MRGSDMRGSTVLPLIVGQGEGPGLLERNWRTTLRLQC